MSKPWEHEPRVPKGRPEGGEWKQGDKVKVTDRKHSNYGKRGTIERVTMSGTKAETAFVNTPQGTIRIRTSSLGRQ